MSNEIGIIMAAGLGTRMAPLTQKVPKPLIKVYEQPMIETVINSLERRKSQSNKILENHPDKVPVILERDKNCSLNKPIKTKYILSKEVTMAEFIKIIR